eukprot:270609-Pleurochrysis_carterae.AAC.1
MTNFHPAWQIPQDTAKQAMANLINDRNCCFNRQGKEKAEFKQSGPGTFSNHLAISTALARPEGYCGNLRQPCVHLHGLHD